MISKIDQWRDATACLTWFAVVFGQVVELEDLVGLASCFGTSRKIQLKAGDDLIPIHHF